MSARSGLHGGSRRRGHGVRRGHRSSAAACGTSTRSSDVTDVRSAASARGDRRAVGRQHPAVALHRGPHSPRLESGSPVLCGSAGRRRRRSPSWYPADPRPCVARYGDRGEALYAIQDTAAAVEHILLAAVDMGLAVLLDRRLRRARPCAKPSASTGVIAACRHPAHRLLRGVVVAPGRAGRSTRSRPGSRSVSTYGGLGCDTLDEFGELIGDCTVPARLTRGRISSSVWVTRTRASCSSVRRPARTRTSGRAVRRAPPASCWTRCWATSGSSAATSTSQRPQVPTARKPRPRALRDRDVHALPPGADQASSTRTCIVTLGNFATKFVLQNDRRHHALHGQPCSRRDVRGAAVFHPAAALYDSTKTDVLVEDFERLAEVLESAGARRPKHVRRRSRRRPPLTRSVARARPQECRVLQTTPPFKNGSSSGADCTLRTASVAETEAAGPRSRLCSARRRAAPLAETWARARPSLVKGIAAGLGVRRAGHQPDLQHLAGARGSRSRSTTSTSTGWRVPTQLDDIDFWGVARGRRRVRRRVGRPLPGSASRRLP